MRDSDDSDVGIVDKEAPELLQRVEELWFEDGTLIIEARGTAFRVYAGLLSARSSVFRDMMSIPQPESSASHSCPTVTLHDSPQDLTHFFKAIMDSQYFEPPPYKTNLSIITGVLRLSTKYDVPYLRRRALMHLDCSYPSTSLKAWDARGPVRTIPPIINTPFMLLCLAREVDVPWIMPQLMYCVSGLPMPILEGILWDEIQVKPSEQDQKLLIVGRSELAYLQNRFIFNTLRFKSDDFCADPEEARFQLLGAALSTKEIHALGRFGHEQLKPYKEDMCESCNTEWNSRLDSARREVWNRLPSVFGYSDWEELNKLRTLDLGITD
ncbi:hypothetical protein K435DRAFT_974800 [Dendrothele bispora CBS 962.96]|uniref:BTB domain-containing protein n=1 Tax=Dendrothele bispora (strain CBS 962.96) TaxID=1314807 RepID=A0A4S8KJH4_DENBC|nr:hypothetical protein K435DRAFT_974800 [Dendrothele bispora CBS 962.96]